MLNEVSQTNKDKYCYDITYMWKQKKIELADIAKKKQTQI